MGHDAVVKLEAGRLGPMRTASIRAIVAVFGLSYEPALRGLGADEDRLIDERHSRILGACATWLKTLGWVVPSEVSYSEFGERGSVDLLAWHPASASLLVIEVKSELASLEATLRKLDENGTPGQPHRTTIRMTADLRQPTPCPARGSNPAPASACARGHPRSSLPDQVEPGPSLVSQAVRIDRRLALPGRHQRVPVCGPRSAHADPTNRAATGWPLRFRTLDRWTSERPVDKSRVGSSLWSAGGQESGRSPLRRSDPRTKSDPNRIHRCRSSRIRP